MARPPFPIGWSKIAITPGNLTLSNTLPVGQSFLWHRRQLAEAGPSQPREEFSRVIDDPPRVILLRQSPEVIYYTAIHPSPRATAEDLTTGTSRRWMEDYFQLARYPDLELMYKDWRERDPGLFGRTELDSRAVGVRVLRQDPWECLVAFITSTNNHIPRISSLMHKLCHQLSPPVLTLENPSESGEPITYHPFPAPRLWPEQLEPLLRELGFGYRAGFIESSLATLRQEFGSGPGAIEAGLKGWRDAPLDVVRDKLVSLKGVGRKVADCVMLMCLDQPSLIPVDTHVGAIAARHPSFPSRLRNKPMSKQLYDEIQSFLAEKWGPMGGWTQAVMFAADLPVKIVKSETLKVAIGLDIKPDLSGLEQVDLKTKGKRKGNNTPDIGLKRTRSATRVELLRSSSSVSLVAEAVAKLPME